MATRIEAMECPFCGYRSDHEGQEEYAMLVHMETYHPEGKSPFVPDEGLSNPENGTAELDGADDAYVECPLDGCNEVLVRDELDYHLELHSDEVEVDTPPHAPAADQPVQKLNEARSRSSLRPPQPPTRDTSEDSQESAAKARQQSAIATWRNILAIPNSKRHKKTDISDNNRSSTSSASEVVGKSKTPQKLGKAELGRWANEQRMPDWLVSLLKKGGQVVGRDIIPVLDQLLEQSPSTQYAYLCHPCVQHVSKLRREGGFCGYRNIQMMSSYIIGAGFEGSHHFGEKLPTIFDIQEFIESAWDKGINKQGRVETGGVRGTRKYIGTPEAQAMLVSLGVPCEAQGFKNKAEPGKAEAQLLVNVERYFQQGIFNPDDKVRCTMLPPIYFQHAGHSMTIVGIEKQTNGAANLLVFDPMFRDASVITQRAGRTFTYKYAESALKAYRRGNKYLKKYREFEVLRLKQPVGAVAE